MKVFLDTLPRSPVTVPGAGWLFQVSPVSVQALDVVAICGAFDALSVTHTRTTALWTVPVMPLATNRR